MPELAEMPVHIAGAQRYRLQAGRHGLLRRPEDFTEREVQAEEREAMTSGRRRKHDWVSKDCYHADKGFCGLKRYYCRNCGADYKCAMYLPPEVVDGTCKEKP